MTKNKLSKKERYTYLINARNFHYENFNKWATYFYFAIGAMFIGYYSIASEQNMQFELSSIILLGYITSILWYWSSKGYYYWNINFITLVNQCEKKDLKLSKKRRVYFVFANKSTQNDYSNPTTGANISTSKVAIFFAFIVTTFWGGLGLHNLGIMNVNHPSYFWCLIGISALSTFILSAIIPKGLFYSKIDHFPDLKINQ